jgi:hypothetical protein
MVRLENSESLQKNPVYNREHLIVFLFGVFYGIMGIGFISMDHQKSSADDNNPHFGGLT